MNRWFLVSKRAAAVLVLLMVCFGVGAAAVEEGEFYTKAEFTAKIADFFEWPHPDEYNDIWKVPLEPINDVSADTPFSRQIETALEEGIIELDAEGNFYPDALITGDEAAAIIADVYELSGNDLNLLAPLRGRSVISKAFADGVFAAVAGSIVAPVQAVPKTNAVAPRRYVKLWCPTPGATIFFTSDGAEPTMDSEIYTVATQGHINEMLSNSELPEKDVVYKAAAMKSGMQDSAVKTYTWHLYRPVVDDFQADLVLEATETSPAVYRVYNDSESVRAMAWYIEGSERGVLFDALQTMPAMVDLKTFVDEQIATKPNFLIVGHSHGDHSAQMMSYLKAGADVYINKRGFAPISKAGYFPAMVPDPEYQKKVMDIEEGDTFSLGNCEFRVFAHPGHADDNIIIQDIHNGLIFASDIYGCTRAGSADNVGVSGVKVDLLLSITQQVTAGFLADGGKIEMLFTGHDESPLYANNIALFEQALQQVVDYGEAACTPTLRGKNNRPGSRTTLVGDMWRDGTDWIALGIGGIMGDDYDYLTSEPKNYNGNGFKKYSELSNIVFEGGDLVGVDLAWDVTPEDFMFGGELTAGVPNSVPDKFDPWTYDYTVSVPAETDVITVIPTPMSTQISYMTLNGLIVDYESRNDVEVADGDVISVELVAADAITSSRYTFTVRKH